MWEREKEEKWQVIFMTNKEKEALSEKEIDTTTIVA